MDELLRDAAERATQYLRDLKERPVAASNADLAQLSELGGDLPSGPEAGDAVLALLDRVGSPATMASAGPRYFGAAGHISTPGGPGTEATGRCDRASESAKGERGL